MDKQDTQDVLNDYKRHVAGSSAPSFSFPVARGGECDLSDLLARKRVVLLSFVDARSQPLSRTHADPSRGELVFLKSMAQQYAPNGLEVLIQAITKCCGFWNQTLRMLFSY